MSGETEQPPRTESNHRLDPTARTVDADNRIKADLRTEIASLRELLEVSISNLDERTKAVQATSEATRIEQKVDSQTSLAAALSAQKELGVEQKKASDLAISKSQDATDKQIQQLGTTTTIAISGLTSSLDDVKGRVLRIESVKAGAQEQTVERRQAVSMSTGLVTFAFGILMTIVNLVPIIGDVLTP